MDPPQNGSPWSKYFEVFEPPGLFTSDYLLGPPLKLINGLPGGPNTLKY